jgi:hypothetical protein
MTPRRDEVSESDNEIPEFEKATKGDQDVIEEIKMSDEENE